MSKEICRNCKWWARNPERFNKVTGEADDKGEIEGWCTRFPPTSYSLNGDVADWPRTYPYQGCGEYKSKRRKK